MPRMGCQIQTHHYTIITHHHHMHLQFIPWAEYPRHRLRDTNNNHYQHHTSNINSINIHHFPFNNHRIFHLLHPRTLHIQITHPPRSTIMHLLRHPLVYLLHLRIHKITRTSSKWSKRIAQTQSITTTLVRNVSI